MSIETPIIITGSRGFLGRHLTENLGRRRVPIYRVGRRPESTVDHATDLSDPDTLWPRQGRPTSFVLVHLAWDISCRADQESQMRQAITLRQLLDYWTPRGLSAVVAAGSSEEYGDREGHLSETDKPVGKLSAYGAAKMAACDFVREWSQRTGRPARWLRPFILYGKGQSGNMLLPQALDAFRNQSPIKFSDGLQVRDFTHVADAAQAFAMAAISSRDSGFETLNVGTGDPVAVKDVLRLLAELHQYRDLKLGEIARRPEEPMIRVADTKAIHESLGWKATIPWQTGMRMIATSQYNVGAA